MLSKVKLVLDSTKPNPRYTKKYSRTLVALVLELTNNVKKK